MIKPEAPTKYDLQLSHYLQISLCCNVFPEYDDDYDPCGSTSRHIYCKVCGIENGWGNRPGVTDAWNKRHKFKAIQGKPKGYGGNEPHKSEEQRDKEASAKRSPVTAERDWSKVYDPEH